MESLLLTIRPLLVGLLPVLVGILFFLRGRRDLQRRLHPFAEAAEFLLPQLHPELDRATIDITNGTLRTDWSVLGLAVTFQDSGQQIYNGPHRVKIEGGLLKVIQIEKNRVVDEHSPYDVQSTELIRKVRHPD